MEFCQYRVLYRAKRHPRYRPWDVWRTFSTIEEVSKAIEEFDTDYYSWKVERMEYTPWLPVSKSLIKH